MVRGIAIFVRAITTRRLQRVEVAAAQRATALRAAAGPFMGSGSRAAANAAVLRTARSNRPSRVRAAIGPRRTASEPRSSRASRYAGPPMANRSVPVITAAPGRGTPMPGVAGSSQSVRRFGLRLLAATLVGLWSGIATVLLVAYRPGGPFDLAVGVAGFVPAAIAALAVAWPPVARAWRNAAVIAWVGILSALLVTPLLIDFVKTLAAGGRQELFPSAEVAYGAVLALGTTCILASLGVRTDARRQHRGSCRRRAGNGRSSRPDRDRRFRGRSSGRAQ